MIEYRFERERERERGNVCKSHPRVPPESDERLVKCEASIPFDSRSKPSLGTASRKQSGRRPLKILLRIVCHFTSERSLSASEDEENGVVVVFVVPRLEATEDEPRCFRLDVTLWLTLGFHAVPCPLLSPLPSPPTPPPFPLFPPPPPPSAPLLLLLLLLLPCPPPPFLFLSFLLSIRSGPKANSTLDA